MTAPRLVAELVEHVFEAADGTPKVLRVNNWVESASQALQQVCRWSRDRLPHNSFRYTGFKRRIDAPPNPNSAVKTRP